MQMVVIKHKNHVVLGPMIWNKFRFQNFLREDLELDTELTTNYEGPVKINDDTSILPHLMLDNPPYNFRTQRLEGPFWTFTDELATGHYGVSDIPIPAVKNFLKQEAEKERWEKENKIINIQTSVGEYSFSTDKLTRATLHQYISLDLENVNWKIQRDNWIVLTKADINLIFNELMAYIKGCYEWELNKISEIDSCTSLQELDSIVIKTIKPDTPPEE